MRTVTSLVLALLAAGTAHAHDLWLEREAGGYTLLYGHRHSRHSGQDTIEYRPEAVKQLVCYDPAGNPVARGTTTGHPARLPGECAAAYALLSSGYWTKTPSGTKPLPKDQVEVAVASWLSFEGVKRIDRWGEGLARPLTEDLELVPLEDPLRLADGDKLRLLVTFRGQPVAGAVVAYDGQPRGETGADGRVNLRIRHRDLQTIEATLRRPLDSARADEEVHTSTLSFTLGPRP